MRALVVLMVLVGVAGAAPKKEPDSLVIVLDRSGSMQGPRLEAAKHAAIAAATALGPTGQIALVAFDSEAQVYVRPQRVGDGTRVAAEIARLQAGGGTNVVPALKEARDIVRDMRGTRHVLVITDGQAPTEGLPEVLWDVDDLNVSVSAIGLGEESDRALVGLIADAGGGRAYFDIDPGALEATVISDLRSTFGGAVALSKHPRGTLVLVIDRSSSLGGTWLAAEKHAAIAAVKALAPADQVAVIAFDSEATVWVPVQPVGDGARVIAQIAALTAQGGTNLYVPLKAARGAVAGVRGPVHVVMLTDGEAPGDGVAELALDMATPELAISTIALGDGADRSLLAQIAGRGGGRVYFVSDPGVLATVVSGEVRAAFE